MTDKEINVVEIQGRVIYTQNEWFLIFRCPNCKERYKFSLTNAMKGSTPRLK